VACQLPLAALQAADGCGRAAALACCRRCEGLWLLLLGAGWWGPAKGDERHQCFLSLLSIHLLLILLPRQQQHLPLH